MEDKEAVDMMRRCHDEIRALRAEIDRLAPKADAYESVAAVLRLLPKPSMGFGEDLAWVLQKRIREIEAAASSDPVEG